MTADRHKKQERIDRSCFFCLRRVPFLERKGTKRAFTKPIAGYRILFMIYNQMRYPIIIKINALMRTN